MTKGQQEKLHSFENTEAVLNEFNLVWNVAGPFKNNVGKFTVFLADIRTNAQIQSVDIRGIRENKLAKQYDMAAKSFKLTNALQMYATDIADNDLYLASNVTERDLMNGNGNTCVAKAQTIQLLATNHIVALKPYGILPPDVDAFNASIASFQSSISSPRVAIDNRKIATKALKVLFKDCRTLIVRSLKKGIVQYKSVSPQFFNKMMESFNIHGLPVHHTEMDFVILDAATKTAIAGVEVIAKMVNNPSKVMNQFSNIGGEADFKEISPELWNIEFVIPSYSPVTKTVAATKGKKVAMTIELEKIN